MRTHRAIDANVFSMNLQREAFEFARERRTIMAGNRAMRIHCTLHPCERPEQVHRCRPARCQNRETLGEIDCA